METAGDVDQSRREWLVVLALTLVAAVPRLWGFRTEGLTHFDEGIYAFAGLWSVNPREAEAIGAMIVPYAPPGFPFLVGIAYFFLGVSDTSILLVSAACGVLTVPVAAWVGRRTFGPGAGASSAAFAALSMAHIAFSRKGLTDTPFLLLWLTAVGLGGWFLERPGLFRAVVLGLAVGLAQNVKYNGGITGLIVAVAAGLGVLADRDVRSRGALARTFGFGLIAAALSGATYWPWYRFVETHGGYEGLLRHQRGYVGGWHLWGSYLRQQLAQVVSLSGGRSWLALSGVVAISACAVALRFFGGALDRRALPLSRYARIGLAVGLGLFVSSREFGWAIGVIMFMPLACDARPSRRVLAAWWLVMSFITPFYHPYARLWLPLHAAGWVMLGGAVAGLVAARDEDSLSRVWVRATAKRRILAFVFTIAFVILLRVQWGFREPTPFALNTLMGPTDSVRRAVVELRSIVVNPERPAAALLIYGRRPIAFYAATLGMPFRLAENLPESSDRSWRVIDSAVGGQAPFAGPGLVQRWDGAIDPVTRLDIDPAAAFHPDSGGEASIGFFRPP